MPNPYEKLNFQDFVGPDMMASTWNHMDQGIYDATEKAFEQLWGTFAARPSASKEGRRYWAFDTGQIFRDTGSAWVEITFKPSAHQASHLSGGSDALTGLRASQFSALDMDGLATAPGLRSLGTGATQAAAGNDSRLHTRAHTLDNATDHTDVDNSNKADGRILVWRSASSKHVYEDPAAASVPDANETTKGKVEGATTAEVHDGTLDYPWVISPVKLMEFMGWNASTWKEGLDVEWVTATQVVVRKGVAWVPGAGKLVELTADATFNFASGGSTLPATCAAGASVTVNKSAAGWGYFYINNSGQAVFHTTAPDVPYRGDARTQSGNTSRRYLRGTYFSAANVVRRYYAVDDEFVRWIADINGVLRALSGGVAITGASVDVSAFAPPTSNGVDILAYQINNDNTDTCYISAVGDGLMTVGGSETAAQMYLVTVVANPRMEASGPIGFVGGVQQLIYRHSASGATRSLNIDIMGYYERTI